MSLSGKDVEPMDMGNEGNNGQCVVFVAGDVAVWWIDSIMAG